MLDTYSRRFFWIFIVIGAIWGVWNQDIIDGAIDDLLGGRDPLQTFFDFVQHNIFGNVEWKQINSLADFLLHLLKLALLIIVGVILIVIWAAVLLLVMVLGFIGVVLYFLKIHAMIAGWIIFYPLYVLFLNLFELFLVLSIRHPAEGDIKYLVRSRDASVLGSIAYKLGVPISENIPELASHVLIRHLRKLKKLMGVELGFVKTLRIAKLKQAMAGMDVSEY